MSPWSRVITRAAPPRAPRLFWKRGISRVVIGHLDPNPGVAGGGADFLRSRGLEVQTGVLEEDCRELLEFFLKFITTGRLHLSCSNQRPPWTEK